MSSYYFYVHIQAWNLYDFKIKKIAINFNRIVLLEPEIFEWTVSISHSILSVASGQARWTIYFKNNKMEYIFILRHVAKFKFGMSKHTNVFHFDSIFDTIFDLLLIYSLK